MKKNKNIQLKLDLFKGEKVQRRFDFTYILSFPDDYISARPIYMRREKGETFIHISSLNMLGQSCFTMFRFLTCQSPNGFGMANDVIIPELHKLSIDALQSFVKSIVIRNRRGDFDWDYVNRSRIYNCAIS